MNLRSILLNSTLLLVMVGAWVLTPLRAQTTGSVAVWRCGQVFTNQPQPGQVCEPLSSVSSTVVEGTRVGARRSGGVAADAGASSAPRDGSTSVASASTTVSSPAANQQARALLQAELQEQEQRWQQLQQQWNQGRPVAMPGQPEGSSAYQDRVAALRHQMQRTQADLAALRRELARWP